MTYFPKTKVSGWNIIVPSIVLPLVYKDFLEANLIEDINKFTVCNKTKTMGGEKKNKKKMTNTKKTKKIKYNRKSKTVRYK